MRGTFSDVGGHGFWTPSALLHEPVPEGGTGVDLDWWTPKMRALASRWESNVTTTPVLPAGVQAEVVELIRTTSSTVGQVAKELDLTETAVREGSSALT